MISAGDRVMVIIHGDSDTSRQVTGVMHDLSSLGVTLYSEEHQSTVFIPMCRVVEVVDLGKEP